MHRLCTDFQYFFIKTGTPYCTDQFCMDQRFKNILQKRNSVGSADIALTALLDHIITEQGSLLISKLEFFYKVVFPKIEFFISKNRLKWVKMGVLLSFL